MNGLHRDLASFLQVADDAVASGFPAARTLLETLKAASNASRPVDAADIVAAKQFILGSLALRRAIGERELNLAGDWAAWSFAPDVVDGQEQTLEIGRLVTFCDNDELRTWPFFLPLVIVWLTNFFYYARTRAAMRNIAVAIWPIALSLVRRISPIDEEVTNLYAMMLGWAAQEAVELAPTCIGEVESLAADLTVEPRARVALVLTLLSSAGRFGSRPQREWSFIALVDLNAHLTDAERLQARIDTYAREDDDAIFASILDDIDAVQRPTHRPTDASAMRWVDALGSLSFTAVGICIGRRNLEHAVEIVRRWYGVPQQEVIDPTRLFVLCPFHHAGYIAAGGAAWALVERDQDVALTTVTESANRFYGVSNSVVGASELRLHEPERFGVPSPEDASAFERALTNAYFPNGGLDPADSADCQIVIRSQSHPIQAIQHARLGRTWPISASLRTPSTDRRLREVLLWSGADSMTEEQEIEVVREIFERAGARVLVRAPNSATVEDFIGDYSNPDYDLFWVMSHGEFNHWSPKEAKVQIDRAGTFVSLDDLIGRAPTDEDRRLLVLNVCDGGRSEENGLLPRVGLAPAVAGKAQAVISHLWPIQGLAAGAFGALLADALSRDQAFFLAYCDTLMHMHQPPRDIGAHLASKQLKAQGIIERLSRSQEDAQFQSWASAVFYQ